MDQLSLKGDHWQAKNLTLEGKGICFFHDSIHVEEYQGEIEGESITFASFLPFKEMKGNIVLSHNQVDSLLSCRAGNIPMEMDLSGSLEDLLGKVSLSGKISDLYSLMQRESSSSDFFFSHCSFSYLPLDKKLAVVQGELSITKKDNHLSFSSSFDHLFEEEGQWMPSLFTCSFEGVDTHLITPFVPLDCVGTVDGTLLFKEGTTTFQGNTSNLLLTTPLCDLRIETGNNLTFFFCL